jgi:hypothetical protein
MTEHELKVTVSFKRDEKGAIHNVVQRVHIDGEQIGLLEEFEIRTDKEYLPEVRARFVALPEDASVRIANTREKHIDRLALIPFVKLKVPEVP